MIGIDNIDNASGLFERVDSVFTYFGEVGVAKCTFGARCCYVIVQGVIVCTSLLWDAYLKSGRGTTYRT